MALFKCQMSVKWQKAELPQSRVQKTGQDNSLLSEYLGHIARDFCDDVTLTATKAHRVGPWRVCDWLSSRVHALLCILKSLHLH